jgi:hypothetical protein
MCQIKVASVAISVVINQIFMVSIVNFVAFEADSHATMCRSLMQAIYK